MIFILINYFNLTQLYIGILYYSLKIYNEQYPKEKIVLPKEILNFSIQSEILLKRINFLHFFEENLVNTKTKLNNYSHFINYELKVL